MGTRGPVPKPSAQRRRRNAPERPVKSAPRKGSRSSDGGAKRPPVDAKWHPIAKRWYLSLAESGQSRFYEPSDWSFAYLLAEDLSRELKPHPIHDDEGNLVAEVVRPIKGAALSALFKGMAALLVTEGDRRRLQIELSAAAGGDTDDASGGASVSNLDAWRSRTDGTG